MSRSATTDISVWRSRTAAALLAGLVSTGLAAERPQAEGLLLYASFDGDGYESLEPLWTKGRKGRPQPAPGERGRYPNAVFAVGDPLPLSVKDVEYDANGKFGGAARVPARTGLLTFDARGNLLTRRGTVAVWVRSDQPLWSTYYRDGYYPRLISIRDEQVVLRCCPFLWLGVNSRKKILFHLSTDARRYMVGYRGSEQLEHGTEMRWGPGDSWAVGTWAHVAVVWDGAEGRKWYHNGRLVASSWGGCTEHRSPYLDQISLGGNAGPSYYRGGPLGFSYDELYVFDYSLAGEQIGRLMADNAAPARRAEPDPSTLSARDLWVRYHYGLDRAIDGIPDPSIPEWGDGVLVVRRVPIGVIRENNTDTRMPADGKGNTVWPLEYKSRTTVRARELSMDLPPGTPFDFVRVRGDVRGELFGGGKRFAELGNRTFVQRVALDQPIAAKDVALRHESGRVNEIAFYRIEHLKELPTASAPLGGALRLTPAPTAKPGDLGDLTSMIAAACVPEDRTAMLLARKPAGGAAQVRVAPYRAVHWVSGPFDADTGLGRILLELHLTGFTEPTHLMLTVHDPVTGIRDLIEFEVRLRPTESGRQTVRILFDGPALLFDRGKRLWMTLMFDRAGQVRYGPGASRLALWPCTHAQRQANIIALDRILCDQFLQCSEPQPWNTMPGGNPLKQLKAVNQIFTLCEHLLTFDPGNETASSILSWMLQYRRWWRPEVIGRFKDPYANLTAEPAQVDGPDWAVYGREGLKIMRRYVDWWVGRQDEFGELGSALNDDTDMMPDVVNFALIDDPDDRLRTAFAKLADRCWDVLLDQGISKRMTDHLHSFEDGTNLLGPLALLFYGDPLRVERLMLASRYYDGHLTGINPHGDRLFRGWYFNSTKIREDQHSDWGDCLVMMPGRYLVWYNGSPRVLEVCTEWMDSWIKRMGAENRDRLYGEPGKGAIDFQTGEWVAGGRPAAMPAHMYWCARMAGDRKYIEPALRRWRQGQWSTPPVSWGYWGTWRRELPDRTIDDALRRRGKRKITGYLGWKLGLHDRSVMIDALKAEILHMKKYLPVHTWVGQSADRVKIPQSTMSTMYLGGLADKAKRLNYHYHAVSWEGADDDLSRFVVEDTRQRLKVLLYSFHEVTQDVVMRVWRLDHGRYRVRAGVDTQGQEEIGDVLLDREMELARYVPVLVRVPPRRVVVVTAEQLEPLDDIRLRPDLAMGPADLRVADGTLEITVHNIGGANAPPSRVHLLAGDEVLAERPVPALPAPIDLVPKTATVRFKLPGARPNLRVAVIVPEAVREITTLNNEMPIPSPDAQGSGR